MSKLLFVTLLLTSTAASAEDGWETLPTVRLGVSLNAERATSTLESGTNYDLTSGGFGIEAAFYLPIAMIEPFMHATLDANLMSADDPCKSSPFDPNTQLCEDSGSPIRVLGTAKAGIRVVVPKDDERGRLGFSAGAQYLIQGIYITDSGGDDNELLPFGQIDYSGGTYVLSGAAGLGGYFMAEYATGKQIGMFDTVIVRLERYGWDRSESVVRGFNLHVAIGTLTWL